MVRCNEHPSKWEAGGKFDGNHVKKLLNSIDRLDSMLIEAKVSAKCLNETVALDSFKRVTDKCFGMLLQDGWEEAIEQFSADFRYLDKEVPLLKSTYLKSMSHNFLIESRQTILEKVLAFSMSSPLSQSIMTGMLCGLATNTRES